MKKQIIASALALGLLGGAGASVSHAAEIKMFKEPPFQYYKVDKGDTFFFIAKRYGLNYQELMKLNPNVVPTNMKVGSIIKLKEDSKSTTPSTSSTLSSEEQQVVTLVNQERAKAGLKPLQVDATLSKSAKAKSQDMHDKNYFDHQSPTYGSPFDQMKKFGISYKTAGENIAEGQTSPAEVMKAWMNSPGHKANILNASYTHIGVGYVKDKNIWTQQFIGK
ncbi:CAP domain-containing protein [Priestia megaterium]|uniref:CAP domain-containing protein n=1 Tax=Priestia megaterium TaxID=1404 RepID=UPI003D27ABE9